MNKKNLLCVVVRLFSIVDGNNTRGWDVRLILTGLPIYFVFNFRFLATGDLYSTIGYTFRMRFSIVSLIV